MADLLPCPFCGHRAETQEYGMRTEAWAVWCVECKAQMESISTEAEAIAAWNRRAPDPRDEVIRGLMEALINAAANLATVSRADQLGDVQKQQCQAWSDEALAAARQLVRQPYMGQIMAECDCPRQDECQRAGRCIAEGRG
jgi:Lar family restriction alleviation protein